MARKAAGEEALPEEDPSNPIFKPLPEPSRLDSFLITNQISNYCNQINGYVSNDQASRCILPSFFIYSILVPKHIYEETPVYFICIARDHTWFFLCVGFVNSSDNIKCLETF